MTFGRHSKREKYRDAQRKVNGKWFYCHNCIEEIDAISKLKFLMREYRKGKNEGEHWERFHQIARKHNIPRSIQTDIIQGF